MITRVLPVTERLAKKSLSPVLYGYEIGWAFAAILDSALTKVEGDLEVGDFYRAQTLLAILTQEAYRRIAIWDFDLALDLGAG